MKLKKLFNCLALLLFVSACGGPKKEEVKQTPQTDSVDVENANEAGLRESENKSIDITEANTYVGDFVAEKINEGTAPMYINRITISVDSVKNNLLFGYSVVAGNKRPFKGTASTTTDGYFAEVKEPGDNKYDGVFTFTVFATTDQLKGQWTANDDKLPVSKRVYTLKQAMFEYNPKQQGLEINTRIIVYNPATGEQSENEFITEDAAKINASLEALKESDVENMYKRDLEVMRNAIYARHGYSFKNRYMRYFFDSQVSWYIPYSTNVTKDLTSLEKKNIELIKRYEDHAGAYYDGFGR